MGLFVSMALVAMSSWAQSYNQPLKREGTREATFLINYMGSFDIEGKGGSGVDVSDDVGWGFGLGYNYDNHWNLSFVLDSNNSNYRATYIGEDGDVKNIRHSLSTYSGQFNAQYNFSEGALTPFVQAGLGWTYIDSNVSNSTENGWCYNDPWYGYRCYTSTYDDNSFSYNAAVGIRWDIGRTMFVRGTYGLRWLDIGGARSTPEMAIGSFEIGSRF